MSSTTPHSLIMVRLSAWINADTERDAMVREWQRLENAVMLKCRATDLDFAYACRSSMAEAGTMRVLNRKIRAADRKLEIDAGKVVALSGATPFDALAKIRLGLKVQGHYDWQTHALELVQSGVEELGRLLEQDT